MIGGGGRWEGMGRTVPVGLQAIGLAIFTCGAVGVVQGVRSERWEVTEARVVRYDERVPWYDSGAIDVDVDFEY
ncbi:MAG TPA: hypothetical protein VJB16_01005, partial [archaeon]|nr:hypothetical protein [archaeon]